MTEQENNQITIAVDDEQMASIRKAVEAGEFASEADVLRRVLNDWTMDREIEAIGVERLRELWKDGQQSGPAIPLDKEKFLAEARRRSQMRSANLAHAS